MSLTRRVLWKIERHIDRDLTLAGLAAEFGVSPYHLSHAFGETTGRALMRYLRARRLSQAAEALAHGAPDILALALDSGYGSHEAFSRAFKAQFGLTPEALRRRGSTAGLPCESPLDLGPGQGPVLAPPQTHDMPGRHFAGVTARLSLGQLHAIPTLWQCFSQQGPCTRGLDGAPWGYGGPLDEDGRFEYGCMVEVLPQAVVPPGFERREQPPARYAVFRHEAHVSTLRGSYAVIMDEMLPACGLIRAPLACLERHLPGFDARTGEGGVELWIPVTGAMQPRATSTTGSAR